MRTFEQALDPSTWTEVLQGATQVAFDLVANSYVEVYLDEAGDAAPTSATNGNEVVSFPAGWDFQLVAGEALEQRVWVRGRNMVRGVRG